MGMIPGNIGIVPSNQVVFRNATGSNTALYKQAEKNYNDALKKLNDLVIGLSQKKQELYNFDAAYNSGVLPLGESRYQNDLISKVINNGDYNDVIDIIRTEGYGFCGSPKWGKIIGNMRGVAPGSETFAVTGVCDEGGAGNDKGYKCNTNKKGYLGIEAVCIPDTANDWYQQIYVEGKAAGGIRRDVQIWLAKHWARTMQSIRTQIAGEVDGYEGVNGLIPKQTVIVNKAKADLDKAIAAEEKASGQRIKEKMVSPEYLEAKAKADKILLDAEAKKRRSRNILILGLAGAALVGVLVLTRKK